MTPLVSVVIPTFNRAPLVRQAVESILAQDGGFRFEIIVIDDGSTYETRETLASYHDRIRYIRQENAGLNAARNHGLRMVSGGVRGIS